MSYWFLHFGLFGTANNDTIFGGTGSDYIDGGAGNDLLDGKKGNDFLISDDLGRDTLVGGIGNDTFSINSTVAIVKEKVAEGIDTVNSYIANYSLGPNVENLSLFGDAKNGTGNSLNNQISGNSRNNILSGGAGLDTMSGGAGNDLYIVDRIGDVVVEADNAGIDTINASFNYSLSDTLNVENLTLIGNAKNGTGNHLNNRISGNIYSNRLNGLAGDDVLIGGLGNDVLIGGLGNDFLDGGLGNDVYSVNSLGDRVVEGFNKGNDTVNSAVNYTLPAKVENLVLITTALNGIGNSGNNRLRGNARNNLLSGGAGLDTMSGGAGNDLYIVDRIGDVVIEAGNAGTDTINAGFDYSLGNAPNVENLNLFGDAKNGTGNSLNNRIKGNAGNNVIFGGAGNDLLDGGLNADTLVGGPGADRFAFASPDARYDSVADFNRASGDRILIAPSFGATSTAQFSYNRANGFLLFGGTVIAQLKNTPVFDVNTDIILGNYG